MNAIPLPGHPVPTHLERRDVRAREGRDEIARILELPPRRLGRLSAEVVEAMRHELSKRERRALEQVRVHTAVARRRATDALDGLLAIDDRSGAVLAADVLQAVCRLEDHLGRALAPEPR